MLAPSFSFLTTRFVCVSQPVALCNELLSVAQFNCVRLIEFISIQATAFQMNLNEATRIEVNSLCFHCEHRPTQGPPLLFRATRSTCHSAARRSVAQSARLPMSSNKAAATSGRAMRSRRHAHSPARAQTRKLEWRAVARICANLANKSHSARLAWCREKCSATRHAIRLDWISRDLEPLDTQPPTGNLELASGEWLSTGGGGGGGGEPAPIQSDGATGFAAHLAAAT